MSYAESYSESLAESRTLSHEVNGTSPQNRCRGFRGVSENIFKTQDDGRRPSSIAREAVEWWMDSPGHRQNILSDAVSVDGVGVWISGNHIYITQDFARGRGVLGWLRV